MKARSRIESEFSRQRSTSQSPKIEVINKRGRKAMVQNPKVDYQPKVFRIRSPVPILHSSTL